MDATASNDTNSKRIAKMVGYIVLAALTVAGIAALVTRLKQGLMTTNLTQHVPWGLWVLFYVYFVGLSTGAFLISTLGYAFRIRRFEASGPLALVLALGCLAIGMSFIWIDLGHPWRFLNVFLYFNPTSVMSWESLFYNIYTVIILAELYLVLKPSLAEAACDNGTWSPLHRILALGGKIPDRSWRIRAAFRLRALSILGLAITVAVLILEGALFAVVKARPGWYSGLLPVIFLISATASGGGLLTFLIAAVSKLPCEKKLDLVRGLGRLTIGIVAIDLLLTISEILVMLYGGMPSHAEGWMGILFGPRWWIFWLIQVGLGAVVPALLVAFARNSIAGLGLAGLFVLLGIFGVRWNIVVPPQIPPQFPTLPDSYHHARFEIGYLPSLNEWMISLGVIAMGILAFIAAVRILPLDKAAHDGP